MIKSIILHGVILILTLSACASLDVAELKKPTDQIFYPLELKPSKETNNLRIDVWRKKIDQGSTDAAGAYVTNEQNMPYHPVGFDLGNCLFYDLYGNLSIRIDHLLRVPDLQRFKIQEVHHGIEPRVKIYAFINDTLKVKPFLGEKTKYQYHFTQNGERATYVKGDAICYTIDQTDSTLFYQKNKRKKAELKLGQGQNYSINTQDKPESFACNDRSIVLSTKYRLDYHGSIITFSRTFPKRSIVLVTMQKTEDGFFVYDAHFKGYQIKILPEAIHKIQGKGIKDEYALISN